MVMKNSNKFNNVALCTTSGKSKVISIAKQCKEVLLSQNVNVMIDENLFKLETKGFKVSKENEIKKKSDLLIAIGGDGTMLNCSRIYGSKGIPILGINLGNLGFLTDINPNDLTANLIKVINGEFKKDSRAFLRASVKGKRQSYLALNEVVIHSGSVAQLIEFDPAEKKETVIANLANLISSPIQIQNGHIYYTVNELDKGYSNVSTFGKTSLLYSIDLITGKSFY